jgi:hypothetical protein
MKKLTHFFLFFSWTCLAQQNLREGYIPLRSKGELPLSLTQDIRHVVRQDLSELEKNKERNRYLKTHFLTASNYQIEHLLKSGNTLLNDEITTYLNQIADLILKDNPGLRSQLNIFTMKSPVVNAYCFDKGFIFVNIGLIAQAETEAQLAYLLCHEITHYTKQHNINQYVRNAEIDQKNYNGYSREEVFIEKCQYSKEHESEADVEGFRLFERTLYNLKQAEKLFDVLEYAHLPFELIPFKKSHFESPGYVLPESYFLSEVSAIRDKSGEDDTKQTHPNTRKRKEAVGTIVKNRDNTNRVNSLLGQEKFEYIRDLARMELCRLYLRNRDYPNALYAAYILLQKYPSNAYLEEIVSKSLYAISLYHKNEISYGRTSYLRKGIPAYTAIESFPQQLYHLIGTMPGNEWTIMSLNYVYRAHQRHPGNSVLASLSDSLFGLMKRTPWVISDFSRTLPEEVPDTLREHAPDVQEEPVSKTDLISSLQKESQVRNDDSVYYSDVFLDLFMNDPEFSEKFPTAGPEETFSAHSRYGVRRPASASHNNRLASVRKVLLVDPFFLKKDETMRQEVFHIASDEKQITFHHLLQEYAKQLNMEMATIDTRHLEAGDTEKMNDFSVINDWFHERVDANKEKNKILNTDEIDAVIEKYGTPYVLKTGFVSLVTFAGKKRTYFYGYLFDIRNNEILYKKYEYFKARDRQDMIRSKTYQMIFEIKHPKTIH